MPKESVGDQTKFDWLDQFAHHLRPWTEEDIRREVAAARKVEVDIRGSEESLPSVDEMMKRYIK